LGLAFVSSANANIVNNPGFEAGATGWTSHAWGFTSVLPFIHTGNGAADTACVGATCITPDPSAGAWLFQDLATAPGDSYSLTFWYNADVGADPAQTPNELRVLFGGSTVAVDLIDITAPGYIQYSNTVTLTATSNTTRLEFLGRQDPSVLGLDDISVAATVQGTTTPEPSAYLLLGSGLVLLAGWRRIRA
jgi:hypothetical protein